MNFAFITEPIAQLLFYLTQTTGNLGWAIILLTLIVRGAMIPITVPGQRQQFATRKKMKKIQPKLNALKEKHKDDAVKLSKAQMDLYKEHDIKLFSFASLLPLVQIVFLIALYHVLLRELGALETHPIFFGIDLASRDTTYILPVVAAALQLIMSIMILPGLEKHDVVPDKSKKKALKELNEKETDQQEMMEAVQQQMVFIFQ
ncbi:YidC/Oxa1 family membrane protein insertase [Candidatus Woesebacteria bacterium]|nr:YidC/Oxa1 family membrane protein insertase [Candidatus Woesebacteria bacterium]